MGKGRQAVPINGCRHDGHASLCPSYGSSKTGDRLIFAKMTAKKNLSPQPRIAPINSS